MGLQDTQTGGCMCGKVRYTFKPPFIGVVSCHCKQCQRLHGNYNPLLIGEKENFTFESGKDNVGWYDSSEKAERGFCKTCGSVMFKRDKHGSKMKVSVGNIDNTSGLKNIKNVCPDEKGDFYVMPPASSS